MRILSVASKLPDHCYSQGQITAALLAYWNEKLGDRGALLQRLHCRARIKKGHLAFPIEHYPELDSWGKANGAWFEVAEELGACALESAMAHAGLTLCEIDALFVVSVTGIASPSVDARLSNRLGLPPDLKRTPIFGLGCAAGAVGLSRAADYLLAYPRQVAVLLAIEICSLTMRRDDLSIANLIATGIFGDGAAVAVVGGEQVHAAGPQILDHRSVFYPHTEDIMGWEISERGFGIILSPELPALIKHHLAGSQSIEAPRYWELGNTSWRPQSFGGLEAALDLHEQELRLSWESLERIGNLSSASVLCVLEDTMTRHRPTPGTMGVIAAMVLDLVRNSF